MTNRLINSASLYLRKHAENPIDWWPWCPEALDKAKTEDKPIFLSIGYSSCHWCTVMEGEAFSDPAVAAYLNAHFVPIKVDREERPDIDSIYMQFLQMMVGQGGWPLNVFLMPKERIPFYGGTYFPLEPRYGRPGFLQVLENLDQYYQSDRGRLLEIRDEMLQGLQKSLDLGAPIEWTRGALYHGLDVCSQIIKPRFGGNCFPMMPYALASLQRSRWQTEEGNIAFQACKQRGLDLALGGIYDHVGGGFHRYTVDSTWTVPHFEKMLYDNGQILEFLSLLWARGVQEPAIQRSLTGTIAWLEREMTAPDGYFYAAQDADSFETANAAEPEEGAFYVWAYNDLEEHLTEAELIALTQEFTVTVTGNFEEKNVLQCRHTGEFSPPCQSALDKLFQHRYGTPAQELATFPPAESNAAAKTQPWPGRIPAVTDTKMIVAWNALMISGLATQARIFNNVHAYHLAQRSAQFILDNQWTKIPAPEETAPDNAPRLHRLNYNGQAAVLAQAEDYTFLIKAFLDLHQTQQACPEIAETTPWLQHAIDTQAELDRWLAAPEGGYYNTAADASDDLVVRERSYGDNATPSANGIAVSNLVRLALLTEDLQYLERSQQTLKAFTNIIERLPQACPSLIAGLDWFEHPGLLKLPEPQMDWIRRQYWPTSVIELTQDVPEGSVGMVCGGFSCLPPALNLETLQQQIQTVSLVGAS